MKKELIYLSDEELEKISGGEDVVKKTIRKTTEKVSSYFCRAMGIGFVFGISFVLGAVGIVQGMYCFDL